VSQDSIPTDKAVGQLKSPIEVDVSNSIIVTPVVAVSDGGISLIIDQSPAVGLLSPAADGVAMTIDPTPGQEV